MCKLHLDVFHDTSLEVTQVCSLFVCNFFLFSFLGLLSGAGEGEKRVLGKCYDII